MTERCEPSSAVCLDVAGRITTDNAQDLQVRIEAVFDPCRPLELDCRELLTISSAGLRVLLMFQKRLAAGQRLRLVNVSPQVHDVVEMTGFAQMLDVKRAPRRISLAGRRLIGRGATGECYQLDRETVVKLYLPHTSIELIEAEKTCAKAAFVAGIPTAISYDMVECDGRLGIVYELIDAQTVSQVAARQPERIPELGRKYAQLAKLIHTTPGDRSLFHDWTADYRALVPRFDFLSQAGKERVLAFLDGLTGWDTYVHGDFNPNNVMISQGEPLLIDMGEFALGCPMFDIASLRFTFFYCRDVGDAEIYPFTGMTGGQQRALWAAFAQEYFGGSDNPQAQLIQPLTLLKGMRCVALFPHVFEADWLEKVKREARERWEA